MLYLSYFLIIFLFYKTLWLEATYKRKSLLRLVTLEGWEPFRAGGPAGIRWTWQQGRKWRAHSWNHKQGAEKTGSDLSSQAGPSNILPPGQSHLPNKASNWGPSIPKYLRPWAMFMIQATTCSFIYLVTYFRNRQDDYKIANVVTPYFIMESCSKKCIIRQSCHCINHKIYFHKLRGLYH